MSVRSNQTLSIDNKNIAFGVKSSGSKLYANTINEVWVRDPSWLAMPSVSTAESKMVGLYAVWEDGNYIALSANGNYTVDWGDGVVENFSGAANAYHTYSYSNTVFDGTDAPVVITSANNTVNRINHNYSNGSIVRFYNIANTAGIIEANPYYAINASGNTFQISTSPNGSAITLTNDGSATLLKYKQAIVTVTPQAGQQLTNINLRRGHPDINNANRYSTGWLDITISGPDLTSLAVANYDVLGEEGAYHHSLERFRLIGNNNITDASNMLRQQWGLKTVEINLPAATNVSYMLTNCANLVNIDALYLPLATTLTGLLWDCRGIRSVPFFDTPSAQDMSYLFYECYNLTDVPVLNTKTVTNMSYMFSYCAALESAPLIDTSNVTNMASMFELCYALERVPLINTSKVTNMGSMFYGCQRLTQVPLLDTSSVTDMNYMFGECTALEEVPLFDTSSVTDMSNMFRFAPSLRKVPNFNTANVTNMYNMFASCYSLQEVPVFNMSKVTDTGYMFYDCQALIEIPRLDTSNVTNMNQMFSFCYSLRKAATLDVGKCTNMSYLFSGCENLLEASFSNTASLTQMFGIFSGCRSLKDIPYMNTSKVTGFGQAFTGMKVARVAPDLVVSNVNSSGISFSYGSFVRIKAKYFKYYTDMSSNLLSDTAINEVFNNLSYPSPSNTVVITGNPGAVTYTRSTTLTAGSTTATISDTSSLQVGMEVVGTGISGSASVTFQDAGDTVTRNGHGFANDMLVSFATIVSTTGISAYTPYYVINTTPNTFQLATSVGGSALPLTTDGSGTVLYGTTITNIVANTNITLSVPAQSSLTTSFEYGKAKRSIARLKGWTVSG